MTPDANDLCVFAVKRGNIKKRMDLNFNHPKFQNVINRLSEKYHIIPLGQLAENIFSGITPKSGGDAYTQDDDGVLFLKSGCLSNDGSLTIDETSKIKADIHNGLMKSSKLQKNDVLVAIVGATIGKVGLFKYDREANINQAIAAIRLKKEVLPEFLVLYLLSNFGQTYLQYFKRPVARANINLQEIAEIGVPLLSVSVQAKYVETFNAARERKNKKIQQANKLLASTSEFVLDKLGLSFDAPKKSLTYAILLSNIKGRIDADFYSPKFLQFRNSIEKLPFPVVCVGDVCEKIATGFAAGKQDQAENLPDDQRVPQLRPFSITTEGELSFNTKKYVPKSQLKDEDYCKVGEVLFNNTNSPELVGKTTVFDSDLPCAASNHITRLTLKDGIDPYYIAAFFNVLLSIGYWKLLCTNFNNQAGVNTETLKQVRIPLPSEEVQNQIAAEIMGRRGKANDLRKEAEQEWQDAKAQFEKELLGN